MPEFAADFRDYYQTATTLDALLAAIAVLSLLTAGIALMLRMNPNQTQRRARFPRGSEGGRARRSASATTYDDWSVEDGILFPTSPADEPRNGRGPQPENRPPQTPEANEPKEPKPGAARDRGPSTRERVVQAVRNRPIEYITAAFGVGFAAGLLVPVFSDLGRQTRLLERLVEASEQRRLAQNQREAERFRQAQ
jgi:hypothetical protein